jgi:Tfp pilus assembly protein PilV
MNSKKHQARKKFKTGFTLVEFVAAVSMLAVGMLAVTKAYHNIAKSNQFARDRAIVSTFIQEEMELLRKIPYNDLLATSTSTVLNETAFTPSIPYDSIYTKTMTRSGITFDRLVYVQKATEAAGVFVTTVSTAPDVGLKLLNVTGVWTEGGGKKKVQNASLYTVLGSTGPPATPTMGTIKGNVLKNSSPITTGVLVVISTTSPTASPPALSSTTPSRCYVGSSIENGTYELSVLGGGLSYFVWGYYYTSSGTITTADQSGITVGAGGTTSGINLSW